MLREMRAAALIVLVCALSACSRSVQHATYPSWEPTSPVVPQVRSRRVARQYLETSRRVWTALGLTDYAYVRAKQIAPDGVHFTLVVVDGATIVERALLASTPGESGLGDRMSGKAGREPELLWRERGKQVGAHAEGAPPLTIDQIYDVCRDQVLGAHGELTPRLYFQLNGLLQHCGFLIDECPDCPVASLVSVGRFGRRPWQQPKDGLCNDATGLVVAGDRPVRDWGCELCTCWERNRENPRGGMRAPISLRRLSAEEEELCRLKPDECPQHLQEPATGNICQLDPRACPKAHVPEPPMGFWLCKFLLTGDGCDSPRRVLSADPACTGRPSPQNFDTAWVDHCQRRFH
jgi:hypothetical protein